METSPVAALSDAHLGEPDCMLEQPVVQEAVVTALAQRASTTLVLVGDTLDLDFGTLTTGIEGRLQEDGRLSGLRAFFSRICAKTSVQEIIYVPGNHDYMVWEWEARQRNALELLASGKTLIGSATFAGEMKNHFLTGIMPEGRRDHLRVVYPDYTVMVGAQRVVLTHGHYQDKKQTQMLALEDVLRLSVTEQKKFLDLLYKTCAQWQEIAHATSICRTRRVGIHKAYTKLSGMWDKLCNFYDTVRGVRGEAPSARDLLAIEAYLLHISGEADPSAFVYGHTHIPGKWMTAGQPKKGLKPTPVYNCGSFVPPEGERSSMLFLRSASNTLTVELVKFASDGSEITSEFL